MAKKKNANLLNNLQSQLSVNIPAIGFGTYIDSVRHLQGSAHILGPKVLDMSLSLFSCVCREDWGVQGQA